MMGSVGIRNSNVEQIVDEGVNPIDDYEQNDARDYFARRGNADGAGAGFRLQAAQAADARDEYRENGRLGESRHEVLDVDQAVDLVQEGGDRNIEGEHGQRAAEDADDVGEHGKQRDHQQRGENTRDHQEAHRIETHGRQRVELLVYFHGSDLRGERGARAPGEQDRRHQ